MRAVCGLAVVLWWAGCGGGGDGLVDAREVVDASVIDAAVVDASVIDAPVIDAPVIDASVIDARPDARVDAAVDAHVDASVDARVDARVDAHVDAHVDASVDAHVDARVDAHVDAHVDASVDAHVDASVDAHVDASVDAHVDAMVDAPPFTSGVSTLAGAADADFVNGSREVARFSNPVNVALGPDGKVYVADFDNGAIRRVDSAGTVDTVFTATNFQRPFGLAFDAAGALYVSTDNDDAGQHSLLSGTIWKVDVTAKTAIVIVRGIGRPRGLAMLPDGRLVLSDFLHHTIRLLDPSTLAITLIAGAYDVPAYANGAGTDARFSSPYGVAVVAGPALIVADYGNQRLRRVALDGTTSTIAGDGTPGFADAAALSARFDHPQGVAADAAGTIYVTDTDNYRVRRLAAGTVDTVAGDGTAGYLDSDDRLAAELFGIEGLCATADGKTLYVADGNRGDDTAPYDRVRIVTLTP